MINNFEQFVEQARQYRLSEQEKITLRQQIQARLVIEPRLSANHWFKPALSFAILLLLTVIPLRAEQALPGDILYTVKEHINEPVRNLKAMNPESNVEITIDRVERQQQEIELLAVEVGI